MNIASGLRIVVTGATAGFCLVAAVLMVIPHLY
jgi:hypothetical protein